jgi:hypothetical protein
MLGVSPSSPQQAYWHLAQQNGQGLGHSIVLFIKWEAILSSRSKLNVLSFASFVCMLQVKSKKFALASGCF